MPFRTLLFYKFVLLHVIYSSIKYFLTLGTPLDEYNQMKILFKWSGRNKLIITFHFERGHVPKSLNLEILIAFCISITKFLLSYKILQLWGADPIVDFILQNEASTYSNPNSYHCLPCAEGCEACKDASPCVAALNWPMRTSILVLACAVIGFLPPAAYFTFRYQQVKVRIFAMLQTR